MTICVTKRNIYTHTHTYTYNFLGKLITLVAPRDLEDGESWARIGEQMHIDPLYMLLYILSFEL